MKTSDFNFELPQELIAQDPLEDRSSSRLLLLDKNTGELSHHYFYEIGDFLNPGDCLVLNDTKVIPARLYGVKEGTMAHIEILLLKRKENDSCNKTSIVLNLRFRTGHQEKLYCSDGWHEKIKRNPETIL